MDEIVPVPDGLFQRDLRERLRCASDKARPRRHHRSCEPGRAGGLLRGLAALSRLIWPQNHKLPRPGHQEANQDAEARGAAQEGRQSLGGRQEEGGGGGRGRARSQLARQLKCCRLKRCQL